MAYVSSCLSVVFLVANRAQDTYRPIGLHQVVQAVEADGPHLVVEVDPRVAVVQVVVQVGAGMVVEDTRSSFCYKLNSLDGRFSSES